MIKLLETLPASSVAAASGVAPGLTLTLSPASAPAASAPATPHVPVADTLAGFRAQARICTGGCNCIAQGVKLCRMGRVFGR